jgi:hypothetical protein
MNLGENRIEMRIVRLARSPAVSRFLPKVELVQTATRARARDRGSRNSQNCAGGQRHIELAVRFFRSIGAERGYFL